MLYIRSFSTFLQNMLLGKSRQIRRAWNLMVNISAWVMPMMLLYWVETYILQTKYRSFSSQPIGLEATADKTKWAYMVMAWDKVDGKFYVMKIDNKTFEMTEQSSYLKTTLTNEHPIHEEIKSRFKSRKACCYSEQNILSYRLLSNNININIQKIIILTAVLYGCEVWYLTLRKTYRLRIFENRVLGKIVTPKRDSVTGKCRKLHNEEIKVV